jgi:hypothetical protein
MPRSLASLLIQTDGKYTLTKVDLVRQDIRTLQQLQDFKLWQAYRFFGYRVRSLHATEEASITPLGALGSTRLSVHFDGSASTTATGFWSWATPCDKHHVQPSDDVRSIALYQCFAEDDLQPLSCALGPPPADAVSSTDDSESQPRAGMRGECISCGNVTYNVLMPTGTAFNHAVILETRCMLASTGSRLLTQQLPAQRCHQQDSAHVLA